MRFLNGSKPNVEAQPNNKPSQLISRDCTGRRNPFVLLLITYKAYLNFRCASTVAVTLVANIIT